MSAVVMTLPAGWMRIDLSGDVDEQVDAMVAVRTRAVAAEGREALAATLEPVRQACRRYARAGAYLMAIAVEPVDGWVAYPQVVVGPFTVPAQETPMDAVLALAMSDPSAELLDAPDRVILRTRDVESVPADAAESLRREGVDVSVPPLARLSLRYALGDPTTPRSWLAVVVAVTVAAESPVEAIVEVLDEIVRRCRWEDT